MRISILGTGNLSRHLASGFHLGGADIIQVYGRRIHAAQEIANLYDAEAIDSLSNLDSEVDLVLVTVSDSAIVEVLSGIPNQRDFKMIAHTAGSIKTAPIDMSCAQGVFYPLQTFSKDSVIDWLTVPLLLTTNDNENVEPLERAAIILSKNFKFISDRERLVLHLSAVMVNNFSNHLFALSENIVAENGLDFDLLKPLILETATKVMSLNPSEAQTGPAKRNDIETMNKHLELLKDKPDIVKIYQAISNSIIKNG